MSWYVGRTPDKWGIYASEEEMEKELGVTPLENKQNPDTEEEALFMLYFFFDLYESIEQTQINILAKKMLSLQNDPKKLALFNGLIESYVMRIKTWDKKDNKSRLNDFIDVIRAWDYHKSSVDDLNKELLEKGLWFEDDKFKEALCTINCYPNNNKRRTLTRYILLKLAFSYWTDFLSNYLTDAELIKKEKSKRYSQLWNMSRQRGNDRLQIEHIEPKNNSDQLFTPYLNKIGNLSLLDPLNNSTLNATPGNKKPYRKLTAEEMYNTTLPYLILFEDIDNFDHWEPADIQARSHRIVERAIKIWPDFAEIKRSLSENS